MPDNPNKSLDAFVARLEAGPLTTQELKELLKEFGRLKVDQYKAWLIQEYQDEFAGSLAFPDKWKEYYPDEDAFSYVKQYAWRKVVQYKAWLDAEADDDFYLQYLGIEPGPPTEMLPD